jgi:arabinofuranosyltransferase
MEETAPPRPGPHRRAPAAAWGVLALAGALLLAHARHFDFLTDDAFISFRYADTLVRSGELTFNRGERVEGYTNFLWTMVVALVLRLGGDPGTWSKALGVACAEGTLVALMLFSTSPAGGAPGRPAPWAALAPLLLALASPFAAWSEGGLETALFTLLVTAGLLRHLLELRQPRRPWSALLLALATLARPDGLLVFAAAAVHRLAHGGATGVRARPPALLRWGLVFAAVVVPYWAWRWSYYGYPLPNTFYAKTGPPLWGPGLRYLRQFVVDTQAWIALALLAVPWRERTDGGRLQSLIAVALGAWTVYVAAVGGDFMGSYRFLVPVLPLAALAVQEGLAHLYDAWRRRGGARAPAWAALAVLLLADAAWNVRATRRALEVDSRDGVDSVGWLKQFVAQTTAIGKYLATAYPAGTTIATTAVGVIPYYSRMPTVDLLGLNDVYVAHEVPPTADRPGHRKAAPEEYVLARRPRLLVFHPWITAEAPVPSDGDTRYWRERGYAFRTVVVPGLQPPYWSYLEADVDPKAGTSVRP